MRFYRVVKSSDLYRKREGEQTMTHFIELTQQITGFLDEQENKRVISVAVEKIDFFYNNHIVFANRAIDVYDSYDEIKNKINKAMKGE